MENANEEIKSLEITVISNESPVALSLPQYQCHKIVKAAKIFDLAHRGDQILLELVGTKIITSMPTSWYNKHQPKVGGYFVVYPDGYISYSPAEAFEDGYSQLKTSIFDPNSPEYYEHLREHMISPLNEKHIRVFRRDVELPLEGACYHYGIQIVKFAQTSNEQNIIHEDLKLDFHRGDINQVGPTGISDQALLAIVLDRYRGFQQGEFRNRHNEIVITKLEEILDRMNRLYRDWSLDEKENA